MTCTDCVHYEQCSIMEYSSHDDTYLQEFGCNDFKNKSDFGEIVRCKDCKWWHTERCAFRGGAVQGLPDGNDYCSHGERKM